MSDGQLDLFDRPWPTDAELRKADKRLRAYARRRDPETSHAAAASITPAALRDSQAAVLRLFTVGVRLHDEAMIDAYIAAFEKHPIPPQSPSGLRTRRRELVDLGYLRDSNVRHVLPSGRSSIVWERNTDHQEARR